jgi:hypothetical protein
MAEQQKPLVQTIDPDNVRELFISGPSHALVGQAVGGDRFLMLTCTATRIAPANLFEPHPTGQAPLENVVVARLVFGLEGAANVARVIARAIAGVDPKDKPKQPLHG